MALGAVIANDLQAAADKCRHDLFRTLAPGVLISLRTHV